MRNATHYYSPIGARVRRGIRRNLTNEELIEIAPSAGASAAADLVSSQYSFVPTIEVVDALRDSGYVPVHATEARTRKASREGFQTHEIRLRRGGVDGDSDLRVGDTVPEIVLKNSHDTGSSFVVTSGLFRAVCANGLLVAEANLASVRVRHVGLDINDVVSGVREIAAQSPDVLEQVEKWQTIELAPEDVVELNQVAIESRWGSVEELPGDLKPSAFLQPRRQADTENNLWNAFNVVQENVVRGGQRYANRDEQGRLTRRGRVRAIGSIDTQRKVNQDLWAAARELAS